jgi:hypothetical protein
MRNIGIIYIVLTGVLFLPVWGIGAERDWQVWLDQSFGHDVSEHFTLRVDQSFRFKQNASKLQTYMVQAGLQQHIKSWIEHGYYVRYQLDQKGDVSLNELRPIYDLLLKWNWRKMRWSNRSRFEYRIFESPLDNIARYRNRFKLVLPWKITPLELKPYGSMELFFDHDDLNIYNKRVRSLIGIQTESDGYIRKIEFKNGLRASSDLYLMYQQSKTLDGFLDEYILGIKIGFFF